MTVSGNLAALIDANTWHLLVCRRYGGMGSPLGSRYQQICDCVSRRPAWSPPILTYDGDIYLTGTWLINLAALLDLLVSPYTHCV
jgi:hypothetical protein